jgi:hypothetical protein
MVNIAKTHKEVLENIEQAKMAETFLQDDAWQKFDIYAQEYNEKATIKRIPHLVSSTEMVIKKIQDNIDLDEDDIAVLHLMQKCKAKVNAKKEKAQKYYAKKKDGQVQPVAKRVRQEIIEKDEQEMTDEDKKHNEKILKKQQINKRRKVSDGETRARDKFFKNVIETYIPNVKEIIESLEIETQVDNEDGA